MFDNFAGSILTWLGIFISGYLIYYGYKYKFVKELFKEKLYKVYLPMFTFLEPYLYKNIKDDGYTNAKYIILFLKEIAEKNYELVKPSIIFLIRKLYNAPKEEFFSIQWQSDYIELCRNIDKEFEKTRKKLFLPTRNSFYRINTRQYSNPALMYLDLFLLAIQGILLVISFMVLIAIFITLINGIL